MTGHLPLLETFATRAVLDIKAKGKLVKYGLRPPSPEPKTEGGSKNGDGESHKEERRVERTELTEEVQQAVRQIIANKGLDL